MRQVQSCLRPATFLAKAIAVEGASCLVHCDEGVDNTAILVSLAKILIDPYYRTIDGFMALIEEDWLQAGFRFADRSQPPSNLPQLPLAAASIAVTAATSALSPTIGSPRLLSAGDIFTTNNNNSHSRSGSGSPLSSAIENVVQQSAATLSALTLSAGINGAGGGDLQQQVPWSPVFWLFLDCVYQIYHQFSREFQFNPQILQFLIQQTAAGQFGTFLANSPKELTELRQANRTLSLWTFISLTRDYFTNPLYDPTFTKITGGSREDPDAKTAPPLPITSNSRRLTFLSGLFDPFDPASPLADWHRMKWMLAHASLPPTPSVLDCCTLLQRRALALKQRRKELSIKLPAAQCKLSAVQSLYVNHIKEERVRDRQQRVAKMLCDKCQAPLCTC
jgi:hypothetical protein